MASEQNSLREHLPRDITLERFLKTAVWALGIPLVLSWLLLMFMIFDTWAAGHALGSLKTLWAIHQ